MWSIRKMMLNVVSLSCGFSEKVLTIYLEKYFCSFELSVGELSQEGVKCVSMQIPLICLNSA